MDRFDREKGEPHSSPGCFVFDLCIISVLPLINTIGNRYGFF